MSDNGMMPTPMEGPTSNNNPNSLLPPELAPVDEDIEVVFAPNLEGTFVFKLIDAQKDVSQSGNPMIIWSFMLDDPKAEESNGGTYNLYTALTPAALWKCKEVLIALGETESTLSGKFSLNPSRYINKRVLGELEVQEYNGRERSQLSNVQAYDTKANGGGAQLP